MKYSAAMLEKVSLEAYKRTEELVLYHQIGSLVPSGRLQIEEFKPLFLVVDGILDGNIRQDQIPETLLDAIYLPLPYPPEMIVSPREKVRQILHTCILDVAQSLDPSFVNPYLENVSDEPRT